jgi:hypothetical protein
MDRRLDPAGNHYRANEQAILKRLQEIADRQAREDTLARIAEYYDAWKRAAAKAFMERFNISPRIYERKLAARRIDPRLIPEEQKQQLRLEAIREAAAISRNRLEDINEAIPRMIDKAIIEAIRTHGRGPQTLSPREEVAQELDRAERQKQRAAALRQRKAKEQERDREGRER